MGRENESEFKWFMSHAHMVKTFKNLLLWNQKADDLETWFAAMVTRVLISVFKC